MVRVYREVEVDVDLEEFDDDELIKEILSRGLSLNTEYVSGDTLRELLEAVYEKRRYGHNYQRELDALIWYGLGRM
jgi:hypothetical protein